MASDGLVNSCDESCGTANRLAVRNIYVVHIVTEKDRQGKSLEREFSWRERFG